MLDGEPAPPRKGASPLHFSAHVYCGQTIAHLSNCSAFLGDRPFVKRFALCYRSVVYPSVCPSCLSVTLVYCGQTVEWIKMKLGMKVGLGPGHVMLDGDPAPLPKGAQPPNFRSMSVVAKRLVGSRCHLVQRYAWAQATLCHLGTQLLLQRGAAPNFRPVSIVAKRSPISATVVHLFNIGDLCIAKVSAVSGPLLSGRGLLGEDDGGLSNR